MSHPKADQNPKGKCTGELIKKVRSKSRYGGWLRKVVDCEFETCDKKLENCPICGYALFWTRTGCGFLTLEELDGLSNREGEVLRDVTLQKGIKLEF